MKILKLLLFGDFNGIYELIETIEEVGHLVINSSTGVNPGIVDYVLFFSSDDCYEWLSNHPNETYKAVLCNHNQILAFKEKYDWYQLYDNYSHKSSGELSVESIIDAIITLSREDLQALQVITLDITNLPDDYLNKPGLSKEEYNKIVYLWNQIEEDYADNKTIHQLFEEQVTKSPNNIALIYQDKQLTYFELNHEANSLASYLKNRYQIQANDLIALYLDRSQYTMIAILAVLKAGAAYVPIDPASPPERINYILNDTAAKIILTNVIYKMTLAEIISNQQLRNNIVICEAYNSEHEYPAGNSSAVSPGQEITSSNLAYVIYTSGTTGTPKGVLQQHKNVHRLLSATNNWYNFADTDVWTLFHSYIFDFSVWEMWGALCYGGKLVIPTYEETRDPNLFCQICQQNGVTVLNQTPTAFYQFMESALANDNHKLNSLRYIIFGGEALNLARLAPWFDKYGYNRPQLVNMYGITETAVHVTYKPIKKSDADNISNIGVRIPDQTIYILDNKLNPLPVGSIGELYIGGAGLSSGYLNLPELSKERFMDNPFQSSDEKLAGKNKRLYKTGDLARYLPDGNVEYLGRNDNQVKIRGFRIELGEIENKLVRYPGIRQAVVLAIQAPNQEDNNKYLGAYYVSDVKLDEAMILADLSTQLPEYMIPNILIWITKLPLTVNGKLDRGALPLPKITSEDNYLAPDNQLESTLCQIYADILHIATDKIGVMADFFKLGGNSVSAVIAVSRLSKELAKISLEDFYHLRSIKKLATHMTELMKCSSVTLASEELI